MSDEDRQLAATVKAAIGIRDSMREQGATRAVMDAAMERTIRAVWPFTREWKYLCTECSDTGLRMRLCTPEHRCNGQSTRIDNPKDRPTKYTRLCAKEPTYEHEYGEACWCRAGERFRAKSLAETESDVSSVGKMPRKPSRWGR